METLYISEYIFNISSPVYFVNAYGLSFGPASAELLAAYIILALHLFANSHILTVPNTFDLKYETGSSNDG